jgi:methylmalonyl-CoA/ethylmalonyl-CoA epimerase
MISSSPLILDGIQHELDHVGILSKNIEKTISTIASILSITATSDVIIDPLQDVKAIFAKTSQGLVLEFLEPYSDKSPIQNSLIKNNNLIHHLAYRTKDINVSLQAIREVRGMPISESKKGIAFDNAQIQFFLLSDGWLIELIEQVESKMEFPNIL